MTRVFIAVPSYAGVVGAALPGLLTPTERHEFAVSAKGGSLLGDVFNRLWCDCLNDGAYTHLAMHHADIQAPPGWLDVLLEQLGDADVVSAVVAVKDSRGLTSTAGLLGDGGIRRLTLAELQGLPPAFDRPPFGGELLLNTALMVVKLGSWAGEFPGFSIATGVREGPDGKLHTVCLPEDWAFSLWAHRAGLKLRASRSLPVEHHGHAAFGLEPGPGAIGHDGGIPAWRVMRGVPE